MPTEPELIAAEEAAFKIYQEKQAKQEAYEQNNLIEIFNTERMPANPLQAELLEAWGERAYKTFTYTGANRCLGGEMPIWDPKAKSLTPVSQIETSFNVQAMDKTGCRVVDAHAEKPVRKSRKGKLYRIIAEGYPHTHLIASGEHRVLTDNGYVSIDCLNAGDHIYHDTIKSKDFLREDWVWDFTVPEYGNYLAGGFINKNTGKTTILSIIAVSLMAGKWLWNGQKIWFPHRHARKLRIIGQDWEKHIKAVLTPELLKWWPKNRPVTTKKNQVGAISLYKDEITGSTLEIMSNLQDPELHEGWFGDFCGYDEPPKRAIRVANARGLIDRLGRELFCMTLLKEAWVDREVIKARNEDGTPDKTVFNVHGDIMDNVGYGITEEGVEQYSKLLREGERKSRLRGIPSYMEGLIYQEFKRETHLKPRFRIPTHWIVDIAIDVHPRERQAILFMATNPQGLRYLIEEVWDHGDGTWVGDEIVRRINRGAYRVNNIIIDPLSKGDSNEETTTFKKVANVLMRHGLVLSVASKDKASGFLEVKTNLMSPNGEPTMFFFDDLVRTVMEIEGYMYMDKGEDKGKPQDKDDHMVENLYRLCLLNTQYSSPEDDYEDDFDDDDRPAGRYTA